MGLRRGPARGDTRGSPASPWRGLAGALAVLAAATLVVSTRGDAPAAAPGGAPGVSPPMSRIVSARVHHTRISTVRNTNARRIGRSLASLRPSWVTGLIRYAQGQHPNHGEVRAWTEITRIVRTASPGAKFDVTLNAGHYRNADEIKHMMHRVRKKLDNDGWFFDFYSTAFRRHPRVIRAAIWSAHVHGEWIGGNAFGLHRKHLVPLGSDFVAVQDFNFKLNLPAVRRLAAKLPVMYHLNNNPKHRRSGGCRFIEDFTTARRRTLIRHRARQQARTGFRVSYPALFPECKRRHRRGNREFLYSYNVFRDPPMQRAVIRLLDAYD